jgi:hypothetical protein
MDSSGRNTLNSPSMRDSVEAILTICGLLLVGVLSTTILTGDHILRKSRKLNYGAELELK